MRIDKGFIGGSSNLLVLYLLKNKDMYGYEIIRELEEKSENVFQYKEGTLYPVLHRLEKEGWVKSYKLKGDRGRERKYYSITDRGKKQLVKEGKQWKLFTTSVGKVIGGDAHGFA